MVDVEVARLLSNINSMLVIVAIMLGITMIFICIFSFHISSSVYETKELIKNNKESKPKTTRKSTTKKD